MRIEGRDDEAVFPVLGKLADPAIEGGEIDGAVHGGRHARGAGCLSGDDGVVQPEIGAVFHEAGEIQFVSGKDGCIRVALGEADETIKGVDGRVIEGIWLASPEDLDGLIVVVQDFPEHPDVPRDEIRALVASESACPNDGEHIRIEELSGLVCDGVKEALLELALAGAEHLGVPFPAGIFHAVIGPEFPILGIGDVSDLTDVRRVLPHLTRYLPMEFRYSVRLSRKTERGEAVIENIAIDASDFAHRFLRYPAEKGEVFQQVEIVFLISRLLWGMRGEDETFPDFLKAAVLLVEVECGGKSVGFIEVPDFWIDTQLIKEARTACTEDDVLGDTAERIIVIKPVSDGAGEIVILIDVRGEEKHRDGAENIAGEVKGFHPDRVIVDRDNETDARVLEEMVSIFPELHGHFLVLAADLVVVTESPEQADADEVLLHFSGRAHVGACEEPETT